MDCAYQNNSDDCGLYAIANAVAEAFDIDPTTQEYILYCVSFISYAHDVMSYVWSCNYHSVRNTRDEIATEMLLVTGFRQCANVRPSRVLIRHGF